MYLINSYTPVYQMFEIREVVDEHSKYYFGHVISCKRPISNDFVWIDNVGTCK